MNPHVELAQTEAVTAAVVVAEVTMAEIGAFIGPAFGQAAGALAAAGSHPVGPPIARYDMHDGTMTVEAGFPCPPEFTGGDGVQVVTLPATTVAMTMHTGPYDGIPTAYRAVSDWMAEHGYVSAERPWEEYLDGPDVPMPRTVVRWPCRAVFSGA